jgi:formate dehydrogenase
MLLMHPEDAAVRNIAAGETVRLASATASVDVPVLVTDEVMPGSVCYPHGWGHRGGWQRANAAAGVNINRLAGSAAGERLSASSLLDGIVVTVASTATPHRERAAGQPPVIFG